MQESTKDADCEVWRDNWPVVNMFLRLQTQWNIGGMGGFFGLNYQSVETLFKIYKVRDHRRWLEYLQVMEVAAMKILNERMKE